MLRCRWLHRLVLATLGTMRASRALTSGPGATHWRGIKMPVRLAGSSCRSLAVASLRRRGTLLHSRGLRAVHSRAPAALSGSQLTPPLRQLCSRWWLSWPSQKRIFAVRARRYASTTCRSMRRRGVAALLRKMAQRGAHRQTCAGWARRLCDTRFPRPGARGARSGCNLYFACSACLDRLAAPPSVRRRT